jgi:hypothetical protein
MAHESAHPSDSPHELLTSVRDLTHQVRVAQRGTWFPLLVLGVITLGAIPANRYGGRRLEGCRPTPGPAGQAARVCVVYSLGALVYWAVALVLAYAATAGFYVYQSRRRGVGTRIQPFVPVGVIIAVLVTAATLWGVYHPSGGGVTALTQVVHQLRTPATAIGLALLVLAWVEGNPALSWFSLGYLIVVLIPATYFPGMDVHHPTPGSPVPRQLIIAGVLLLGSLAFAMTRPARPRDAQ